MHKDQLINLFSNIEIELPKRRNEDDYLIQLNSLYDYYINLLEVNDFDVFTINEVKSITSDIKIIIQNYYNGLIGNAYTIFKAFMNKNKNLFTIDRKLVQNGFFMPLNDLYRTRIVEDYRDYNKKDIFHVPFKLRTKIENARYSIAGYPSLYLSSTIKLCHYESGGANHNYKLFSKYRIKKEQVSDVFVLDFGVKPSAFVKSLRNNEPINYLNFNENYIKIYPLLAAVSFIKPNSIQKFIPEYIISQFVLQWLRECHLSQNTLCGVRYFSSKDIVNSNRGYNYVFPTLFNENNPNLDYCPVLSSCCELTKPFLVSKEERGYGDFDSIIEEINNRSYEKID